MSKEKIASLIMRGFQVENSRPGHCLDHRWLNREIIDKLNPVEQIEVQPAINDLENRGLIMVHENKNGFGWCMELMEQGYNSIYPIEDEQQVVEEIAGGIMLRFAKTNSRVDDIIQNRWLIHGFSRSLNPRKGTLK